MSQLSLFIPAPPPAPREVVDDVTAATALSSWLSGQLSRPVGVTLTDNRSTLLSYREQGGMLRVRIQRGFRAAGEAELEALAAYLRGRPSAAARQGGRVLDEFFKKTAPRLPATPAECRPVGRVHHLGVIWTDLNQGYFHDASQARITWGTAASKRYRRTIQLGCYVSEQRLIRIHPSLDQAFVPRFYVASIVFHEMLHEVLGVEARGGRRCVHPPEMRAIEESHPDHGRAQGWEKQNIHDLLRYRG